MEGGTGPWEVPGREPPAVPGRDPPEVPGRELPAVPGRAAPAPEALAESDSRSFALFRARDEPGRRALGFVDDGDGDGDDDDNDADGYDVPCPAFGSWRGKAFEAALRLVASSSGGMASECDSVLTHPERALLSRREYAVC